MKKSILLITTAILAINGFSQSWGEIIKVVASDRAASDEFGCSVSIDGNKAIVGTFEEDEDALGANTMTSSGSAYIFELIDDTWIQTAKLVASDREEGDFFGESVSISGNLAIVGASREDEDASGTNTLTLSGSAYIFELVNGSWTQTAKLVASDRDELDGFGYSVSISGEKAIVGAYQEDENVLGTNTMNDSGSAYFFEKVNGDWTEVSKVVASDRQLGDFFGYSVSISGDKAIIGAHAEDENASGGNTMVSSGSAYIFERVNDVWIETAKLVASDRDELDKFGCSVSISGDKAIIGAYEEEEDASGNNTLTKSGSAYIFELVNANWTQTAKLVDFGRAAYDSFGMSVSISGDIAIVGAYGDDEDVSGANLMYSSGSACIFSLVNGTWIQASKIVASDRDTGDSFGLSVGISGDKAIVSARFEDEDTSGGNTLNNSGSAYLFNRCASINNTVSVSGDTLIADQINATYQWLDCDNNYSIISDANEQTYLPEEDGNFAVEIVKNGCTSTSICHSFTYVGLEESKIKSFSAYPNPTKQTLTLELSQLSSEDYTITDQLGRVVKEGEILSQKQNIDVSDLLQGVYVISVDEVSQKFIKE